MIAKYNNVFLRAIQEFGYEAQLWMATEKMSELIKEICKNRRDKKNYDAIAEEMADVYIMLAQMRIMFLISDEVDVWIYRKVEGLRKMLEIEDDETRADGSFPDYERGFNDGFDKGKRVTLEAMKEIINDRVEVLQGLLDRSVSPILRQDAEITKHALEVIKEELVRRLEGGDDNG